jgi:hypothetical protein
MRTSIFFRGLIVAGLLVARAASAEPGYEASKELKLRHDALVAQARKPARSTPHTKLASGEEPMSASGRLERFEDGHVWLSLPVTPEQEAALVQSGLTRAARVEEARPGTIFSGRAYVSYGVGMSTEICPTCDRGLIGPDAMLLERRVGQDVTLDLVRDVSGRLRVVGVH